MVTPPHVPEPRHVRDPRALNALAHPVRLGIIELLSISGEMTATELAEALDETPANCSWHLRKLAEHGFVEEAGGGAGRRRPWKMTQLGFRSGSVDAGPEERHAARGLRRVLIQRFTDRYLAATELLEEREPQSLDAVFSYETASWLTPEEMRAVGEELVAIVERYRERVEDPARRPEGARLVELVAWGTPVDVLFDRPGAARDQGQDPAQAQAQDKAQDHGQGQDEGQDR